MDVPKRMELDKPPPVDLNEICKLAANWAGTYVAEKTGVKRQDGTTASCLGDSDYFTYAWLKRVAEEMGRAGFPVVGVHVLPETEDGDPSITNVVLVCEKNSAALDLICTNLESEYRHAARNAGIRSLIAVRSLSMQDAKSLQAVIGGFHNPAVCIWPPQP